MLLTLTTTHPPATDLGYLLHKNPARCQSLELSFGQAHVFYPEASDERCTAALLLDVDPVKMVRGRRGPAGQGHHLDQYVNDRPYVASSFLSVAIAEVYGTALGGRSRERPELAQKPLPLEAKIAVLPCRGGEGLLRRLFEPLGYSVSPQRHPLDEKFPDWGDSPYFTVRLEGLVRLQDLLAHLYVLVPVLDDDKHYWVGEDEVNKLLRHGADWLPAHPEKEAITKRYLKHQRRLARAALARIAEESLDPERDLTLHAQEEAAVENRIRLSEQRLAAVTAALKKSAAKRVLDLGCGEGNLLRALMEDKTYEEIVGLDVSLHALEIAGERLNLDRLTPSQQGRIRRIHGSLMYRDKRLSGYDAAVVMEVIEHFDPPRLSVFERVVFECARPKSVLVTTPNFEYNAKFESLPSGKFRHRDHRFEWTRLEFQAWAIKVGDRFGYSVEFIPIGPEAPLLGPPTQMAVFNCP